MHDERKNKKYLYCYSLLPSIFLNCYCQLFNSLQRIFRCRKKISFKKPKLTTENILNNSWTSDFEKYTQDQFFQREFFRLIKANTAYNIFHNLDNNGLYHVNGFLSKIEYPSNEFMWQHATDLFNKISGELFDETNKIYYSIIPDKNYYLAKNNGYLYLDYSKCF